MKTKVKASLLLLTLLVVLVLSISFASAQDIDNSTGELTVLNDDESISIETQDTGYDDVSSLNVESDDSRSDDSAAVDDGKLGYPHSTYGSYIKFDQEDITITEGESVRVTGTLLGPNDMSLAGSGFAVYVYLDNTEKGMKDLTYDKKLTYDVPSSWLTVRDTPYKLEFRPSEGEADYEIFLEETGGAFMDNSWVLITVNSATPQPLTEAYVNGVSGNDNNDGRSTSTAFKTIEHALSEIDDGGTVYISGSYQLDGVDVNGISISKSVSIVGLGDDAVIDANNACRIFNIGAYTVALSNLAFVNADVSSASDKRGGALYVNGATLTIDNCKFIDNTAGTSSSYGGAINLKSSSTTIIDSYFEGNTALYTGGAINAENSNILLDISGCTFTENGLTGTGWAYGGTICSYGTVTIDKSIFYGNILSNTNGRSINMYSAGSLSITNSVLLDGEGSVKSAASSTTLENNWWGNNEETKDSTPTDLGYTTNNVDSYLYLALSTAAPDLRINTPIDIDIEFIPSTGGTVNLPDLDATVSSSQGTFDQDSLTLIDGAGQVEYTSTTVGDNVIAVDVLGVTDEWTLNFANDYDVGQVVPNMVEVDSGVVSGNAELAATHPWATSGTLVYTIPDGMTDVKSAIVIVNIYSGNGANNYGLYSNVTMNTPNGLEVLGYETLRFDGFPSLTNDPTAYGINAHTTRQYSDYQMIYDVTDKIADLQSGDEITIGVVDSAITGLNFDGRIKLISLFFAYDDGDYDKYSYWLEAGQLWTQDEADFSFYTEEYSDEPDEVTLRLIACSSSLAGSIEFNDMYLGDSSEYSSGSYYQDCYWDDVYDYFVTGDNNNLHFTVADEQGSGWGAPSFKANVGLLTVYEKGYLPEAYVDYANGDDDNNGASLTTAFKTMDHALSEVENGGTIYVSGTYELDGVDVNGINIGKSVSIIGLNDAVFDANNAGRIFNIDGAYTVALSNLRFVNADVSSASDKRGGALWVRDATLNIDNCQFIDNTAGPSGSYGGAINLKSTSTTITDSYFEGNTAFYTAGAINAESGNVLLDISGCTFTNNEVTNTGWAAGGTICSYGPVTVDRSVFYGNKIADGKNGRSINMYSAGSLTVTNSILLDGDKSVYSEASSTTLENNWWGNNDTNKDTSPTELGYTNKDVTSYSYLSLSSAASNPEIQTPTNININLVSNANLPDIPATVSSTQGTFNKESLTLENGAGVVSYTSNTIGDNTITVDVLGITDSLTLNFKDNYPVGQVVPSMSEIDTGVVSGGVDYAATNPGTTSGSLTYTIPEGMSDVKSAIVIINIYSGSGANTYGVISDVTMTTANGQETLGHEELWLNKDCAVDENVYGINNHATKQYSDFQLIYDVTDKVSNLNSGDTITINVADSNDGSHLFDGRIKLISLFFAYDDEDNDKYTYWLDAGQLWTQNTANFNFNTRSYAGATDNISLRSIVLSSSAAGKYLINNVQVAPDSVGSGGLTYKDIKWNNISANFNKGSNTNLKADQLSGSHKFNVGLLVATELETPALPDVSITQVKTPWTQGVYAGVNNTFTVTLNNAEDAAIEDLVLEVYSNETGALVASYTINSLASGTSTISVTDPTVREITEQTVWPAAQNNKIKYTFNLMQGSDLLSTLSVDKILAYDGYFNQTYAYNGHGNIINRKYTISGDIIISTQPESSYKDQFTMERTETWNIETPEDAEVVAALLYFAYNWDTSYYPDGWTLEFSEADITGTEISHEMDRGNLGYYGAYNYGLVVFDVTDYYKINDENTFTITKTGNCALYPSTLFVLYNVTDSVSVKDVYFSDICDVFYPYYNSIGYDDLLSAYVNYNDIELTNMTQATWYVFAGSAGYNDADLSFNDLTVSDAYPSSSDKECVAYEFDVTNGISQNNLAKFITTTRSSTVVAYEQVLVVERTVKKLDAGIYVSDSFDVEIDGTVDVIAWTDGDGELTYSIADESIATVSDAGVITGVAAGSTTLTISVPETENYYAASVEVPVTVIKLNPTITVSDYSFEVDVDDTVDVGATTDSDGELTYSIADESIATVSDAGVVTGVIGGSTTLIISVSETERYNADEVYVDVIVNKLDSTITVSDLEVDVDGTVDVGATTDSDGELTYSIADESVATVSDVGVVTGVIGGSTTLTVSVPETDRFNAATADVTVTVNKLDATITVSDALTVDVDGSDDVEVITDSDGALSYVIADTSIATVSDAGVVTGVIGGSTTLTVSVDETDRYNAASVDVAVTVQSPAAETTLKSEYTSVPSIYAGVVNNLTLTVANTGVAGADVVVSVFIGDELIGNATIADYAAGETYTFNFIDTTIRPVTENTVIGNNNENVTYTVVVENAHAALNTTDYSFVVLYNGNLGKDYAYPNADPTLREYTVNDVIVLTNGTYGSGASETTRTDVYNVEFEGTVAEALLYVPYTWDKVATGDFNTWNTTFNGQAIAPIASYRDQGNLGKYGTCAYGLVVYNVTNFLTAGENTFALNKTKGNVGVYPTSLVVLIDDPSSLVEKTVYIWEEADLLSKSYNKNLDAGFTTSFDTIDGDATLYVFAASAQNGDGDLIVNDDVRTNVWSGSANSFDIYTTAVDAGEITVDFVSTGSTILGLHQMVVVENDVELPTAETALKSEYTSVPSIYAGVVNNLTLTVTNNGVTGENVKIYVFINDGTSAMFSDENLVGNVTVADYAAGETYTFNFIDTTIRPITENTVIGNNNENVTYTVLVQDIHGALNFTDYSFVVLYNGNLGKDYAYPNADPTLREYTVNDVIVLTNGTYGSGASETTRTDVYNVEFDGTVAEALLYVPYTWDKVATGDFNNWNTTFNGQVIAPIASYRDQGNLGKYGNCAYGLVVYNVTSFVAAGENTFVLNKTKGNVGVYPTSLVVLIDDPTSLVEKTVYIWEEADLLSKSYNKNLDAGFTTSFDTIDGDATLYVFAASAQAGEGNLIINDDVRTDVWTGTSNSFDIYTTAVDAGEITVEFVSTGSTILGLHQMVIVENAKTATILDADDLVMAYKDGSAWEVTLTDANGDAIAGVVVKMGINVNGVDKVYSRVTDENGVASLAIGLAPDTYAVNATFEGNDDYGPSFVNATVTVNKATAILTGDSFEMSYKDGSAWTVTLTDANGIAISGVKIAFGIENKTYNIKTDDNGVAELTINLYPGTYDLTASLSNSKYEAETITATVTVNKLVPTLSAEDLVMTYKDGSSWDVTLKDAAGNIMANTYVKFTIGNKTYTRKTNDEGIASLPIGLPVGEYTITAEFEGTKTLEAVSVNCTIVVNQPDYDIVGEDVNMTYKDGTTYNVQITDGDGNPVAKAGVVIKMTINGVSYNRKTNDEGIASLAIGLKAGTYDITAEYNGKEITNTIVVNRA